MKRLEYTRCTRGLRIQARTTAEAVMVLAQVTRERHRLEQERRSLEKRMRRIEVRLSQIAGAETKLVPVVSGGRRGPAVDQGAAAAASPNAGEITLQY